MNITINNKEYQLRFDYVFVKWVMKQKKFTKFTEYDAFLKKFAFDEESFGPEHVSLFAQLVKYGAEAAQQKAVKLKLEDLEAYLFMNPMQLQEIAEEFIASQPKVNNSVVDPSSRKSGN